MPKRKTIPALLLASCIAAACLLSPDAPARVRAQAGEGVRQAGAPLKGVEVKLAKYAGAQSAPGPVVASATSDENGKFKLPVVPAGKYVLVLELPKDSKDAAGARQAGTGLDGKIDGLNTQLNTRAFVTLNLPGNKKVEKGYDFAKRQTFDPLFVDKGDPSAARLKGQLADLLYESDGVTPCEGAINTTRSNLKNTSE